MMLNLAGTCVLVPLSGILVDIFLHCNHCLHLIHHFHHSCWMA